MANGIKLLRGTLVEHNNFNDFENGEIKASGIFEDLINSSESFKEITSKELS